MADLVDGPAVRKCCNIKVKWCDLIPLVTVILPVDGSTNCSCDGSLRVDVCMDQKRVLMFASQLSEDCKKIQNYFLDVNS